MSCTVSKRPLDSINEGLSSPPPQTHRRPEFTFGTPPKRCRGPITSTSPVNPIFGGTSPPRKSPHRQNINPSSVFQSEQGFFFPLLLFHISNFILLILTLIFSF